MIPGQGHSMWFARSLYAWIFSRDSGVFPHPQMCIWHEVVCLYCPSLSEYRCEWEALPWKGILSRVDPVLCPEERLQSPMTLNWNKKVGKSFCYLFLFIFLKCMYITHLFQCLILEVLGYLFRSLVMFLWLEYALGT